MQSRIRAVMLGLLAVMLAGSVMAATASANLAAGPFWHHRPIGETKNTIGEKVEAKAPENFKGSGGKQILLGELAGDKVEIAAESDSVVGALFNNANQGQIKFNITYNSPKLEKPVISGCEVKIGTNNVVQVKGHLDWKWNGEPKQLTEPKQVEAGQTPDILFSAVEPQAGTTELKEGTFTTITLTTCGVLNGKFNVTGSEAGIPNRKIEEWSRKLAVRTLEPQEGFFLQHDWTGAANTGFKVPLVFGNKPASLIGQNETESEQQELAVFEN
jgi:hypothetical protein